MKGGFSVHNRYIYIYREEEPGNLNWLYHIRTIGSVHITIFKSRSRSGGKDLARSAAYPKSFGIFVVEKHLEAIL